eukprot:SAG11_NODE_569_length_8458_cov_5.574231_7_plen_75_part_00
MPCHVPRASTLERKLSRSEPRRLEHLTRIFFILKNGAGTVESSHIVHTKLDELGTRTLFWGGSSPPVHLPLVCL